MRTYMFLNRGSDDIMVARAYCINADGTVTRTCWVGIVTPIRQRICRAQAARELRALYQDRRYRLSRTLYNTIMRGAA